MDSIRLRTKFLVFSVGKLSNPRFYNAFQKSNLMQLNKVSN